MASPADENKWDANVQEKGWRNSKVKGREAIDKMWQTLTTPPSNFFVLCLAEVDAVDAFNWSECFTSREAFVADLKRLIANPTTPSRPVPDIQAYNASQKWFLEMEIKQFESYT